MPDIKALQQQLQTLQQQVATLQGRSSPAPIINLDTHVIGMLEVVSAVPSGTPRTAYDQIKIYTNSTTYRLYWYDWNNHAWRYATGT